MLIVPPEYNFGMAAVLKNAIDPVLGWFDSLVSIVVSSELILNFINGP